MFKILKIEKQELNKEEGARWFSCAPSPGDASFAGFVRRYIHILARRVTFRYKKEFDPKGIPQFGLVAEEVEKINQDLVARDDHGRPYTVRYEAVNAMLLNEFLKEHRKGEEQDRKIEELEATVAKLQSALKEQAAQIQKVSAELEVNSPRRAPRVVADNQ